MFRTLSNKSLNISKKVKYLKSLGSLFCSLWFPPALSSRQISLGLWCVSGGPLKICRRPFSSEVNSSQQCEAYEKKHHASLG